MSVVDIRVSVDFPGHPKTLKLIRRLGPMAVWCLLKLWTHTRLNRPEGVLSGMDEEDIEIASGWTGEPGVFVRECKDIGWLDRPDPAGPYECHDWPEHQPYSIGEPQRADVNRFKRLSQVAPEEYKRLRKAGVTAISKPDYEAIRKAARLTAGQQPAGCPAEEGEQPAPYLTLPYQKPLEPSPPLPPPAAESRPGPSPEAKMEGGEDEKDSVVRMRMSEIQRLYATYLGKLVPSQPVAATLQDICQLYPPERIRVAFAAAPSAEKPNLNWVRKYLDNPKNWSTGDERAGTGAGKRTADRAAPSLGDSLTAAFCGRDSPAAL